MMMNMVMGVIAQDNTLSYDDAAAMVTDARTAALAMFPGKELAYDLIWEATLSAPDAGTFPAGVGRCVVSPRRKR